jgi:hypothetical protein
VASHAPRSSLSAVVLTLVIAGVGGAATGGCFDSDDKLMFEGTTSTTTTSTTTDPSTTSTTEPETTGGPSVLTCRDAIGCIQDCALDLIQNPMPEPDLSCILQCVEQEGLSVRETYNLLNLANCSGDRCGAEGFCGTGGDTDTDTDTDGTGTGTGGSTTGSPPPPGLLDPCLECLFNRMGNQNLPGCEDEHAACT